VTSIPAVEVDRLVIRELKNLAKTPEVIQALVDKANQDFKKDRPNYQEALFSLKKRLDGVTTKVDRIMDEILSSKSSDEREMWISKSSRLHAEKQEVEQQIQNLRQREDQEASAELNGDAIVQALEQFEMKFESLPLASRRGLVTSMIERIEVTKNELVLNIKNPGFSVTCESATPRHGGGLNLAYRDKLAE